MVATGRRCELRGEPPYRWTMDISIHELFTDRELNAEMSHAGKRYAARRAAELIAEDPTRTAQQLVDLLREEADAAKAEFERVRADD